MAKASKAVLFDDPAPPSEPVTETLTYMPEHGGPNSTIWGGITFYANVPKELTGNPNGTKREQLNMQMIETARASKFWAVGDTAPSPRRRTSASQPETPEEYRAYMIDWLKGSRFEHADDLIARFVRDRELQQQCEVGADDYAYLGTLFMPKLHELAKGDELTEQQVAHLWLQHGVNQLPW